MAPRKFKPSIPDMRVEIARQMTEDECYESFEEALDNVRATWTNDDVMAHWEVFEPRYLERME